MLRKLALAAAAALLTTTAAYAQKGEYGTAAEAKAMIERASAAVKTNKATALKAFNDGADGFKDRDLYVLCANASDGLWGGAVHRRGGLPSGRRSARRRCGATRPRGRSRPLCRKVRRRP